MNAATHRWNIAIATASLGLALCTQSAPAGVSDLTAFLQRAEKMGQINRALRVDVRVTRDDGSHDTALILADPARSLAFVAVRSDGFRALAPLEWKTGISVAKDGATPATLGADDPLGALGLRATDLFPPWAHDYTTAFISDETPHEKTVTVYGTETIPYSLFVMTFDKERLVPTLTKYYRERLNNLIRLRKDDEYVMIGARPRPQKVTITDYVENSATSYDLLWSEVASLPAALFDDKGFATAEVPWPDGGTPTN